MQGSAKQDVGKKQMELNKLNSGIDRCLGLNQSDMEWEQKE